MREVKWLCLSIKQKMKVKTKKHKLEKKNETERENKNSLFSFFINNLNSVFGKEKNEKQAKRKKK